jgi:RimJ/RimL family protein N-acetyltransferase
MVERWTMKTGGQRRPRQAKLRPVTLSDHRVVGVRPLEQRDREDLADAFSRLSPQTRYLRFANAKPHMSSRELDFLVDVGRREHRALLAVDPETGWGVGVVRYVALQAEPNVAEVAATVSDGWQGQGLGSAMVAQLIEQARDDGLSALRASVLASNNRSIAMLLRTGFAPLPSRGTLREYELALQPPTP